MTDEEFNEAKQQIAALKAQIEAANESQKKINQIVGTACAMVLGTALLLIGWNAFKTYSLDEREKSAIRSELRSFVREELATNQSRYDERMVTLLNQQVPNINKGFRSIEAHQINTLALLDLGSKDYLNGTVRTILACSFYLMAENEVNARSALKRLQTQ